MTWHEFFAEPISVKYLKPGDEIVVSEGASLRLYTVTKSVFTGLGSADGRCHVLLQDPRRGVSFEISRALDWDFHRVVPALFAGQTACGFRVDIETSIVEVTDV